MPTYDYRCDACGHEFEEFQAMSAKVLRRCPACRKQRLRRLFGTGAAIIFKGSGFYETDYKRKSPPGGKSGGDGDSASKESGSGDGGTKEGGGKDAGGTAAPAKDAAPAADSSKGASSKSGSAEPAKSARPAGRGRDRGKRR